MSFRLPRGVRSEQPDLFGSRTNGRRTLGEKSSGGELTALIALGSQLQQETANSRKLHSPPGFGHLIGERLHRSDGVGGGSGEEAVV
jgi:hypothetical protein